MTGKLPLILAATALILAALPVGAQPPDAAPVAAPPADKNAPRVPENLKDVLASVRWDAAANGPLLVVAPEQLRPLGMSPTGSPTETPVAPLTVPASGLPMHRAESYFGLKVVACGSISALAPATMTVLNYTNLPKPSAYAGVEPADRMRFLIASLTPAQWRKIGSEEGLGSGDLDRDQRELWAGLPFSDFYAARRIGNQWEHRDITPAMCAEMRLHIARTINYEFRRGQYLTSTWLPELPGQDLDWFLSGIHVDELVNRHRSKILGQTIRSEVPSRAKPGDLDFDWSGLDAPVSLRDVKTVGELVTRIRDAAKVELFCDVRYRSHTVHTRGAQARAGDVLRALCRALTGTVRRVSGDEGQGSAFVVTDDLIGFGARHALIQEWTDQNAALIAARERKLDAAIRKARPGQYLTYEPGDPMTPSAALDRKIANYKPSPVTPEELQQPGGYLKPYLSVRLTELPPASQSVLRAKLAELQKEPEEGQGAVRADVVWPQLLSQTYLVLPGIGKVKADGWGNVSDFLKEHSPDRSQLLMGKWEKKPLTGRIARRSVIAWMQHRADTGAIARAAKRAGFTELWIDAPLDGKPTAYLELLTTAVKAAKAEGLTARVMVRALRSQSEPKDGGLVLTPERNVQGETWTQAMARYLSRTGDDDSGELADSQMAGEAEEARVLRETLDRERRIGDWASLPTPAQRPALREWIGRIAAIADVDGLVVRDLQPPGFNPAPMFSMVNKPIIGGVGYTPERRLRFLRETGVDPVDLPPGGQYIRMNGMWSMGMSGDVTALPLFSAQHLGSVPQQWDLLRRTEGLKAVSELMPELRRAAGKVPLWLYYSPTDPTGAEVHNLYVESLDKPDAPPLPLPPAPRPDGGINFEDPSAKARKRSSLVLQVLQCQPFGGQTTQLDQFLMEISGLASTQHDPFKGYDGLVVDLNRRTPDAVRLHLEALPPFVPPAAAAAKP